MFMIRRCWEFAALLLSFHPFAVQPLWEQALPAFGRDTVLVYRASTQNAPDFVVRIGEFVPDRLIEWEDSSTQGTILLPAKALSEARNFLGWQLFQAGVDSRSKNATTLWLSRRVFREIKERKRIKFDVDSVPAWVTLLGGDQLAVDVNRSQFNIPVIKTKDDRGTERWFIDQEENPLIVNLMVRDYQQKLASITTDRANTLRWLKKIKLPRR